MAGRNSNSYYTDGNTARTMKTQRMNGRAHTGRESEYIGGSAAPKRRTQEQTTLKRQQKKQIRKHLTKEEKRASYQDMHADSMSLGYLVFLSAMVIIAAFLSLQYLRYQSDISEKKAHINALKSNIEVISSQNDAISYDIDAFIDINRIINVATNELGMVMADSSQIKYFEEQVDEFMNQYADVPEK